MSRGNTAGMCVQSKKYFQEDVRICVSVKGKVMCREKVRWGIKGIKSWTGDGILVCSIPALLSIVPFTLCLFS